MSSKILNILLLCVLSLSIVSKANAGLIEGHTYLDEAGKEWTYYGSFDLSEGREWRELSSNGYEYATPLNGLEAVQQLVFPELSGLLIALSTNIVDPNSVDPSDDYLVNHNAWYDSFYDGNDPAKVLTAIHEADEAAQADFDGDSRYDEIGDISAYIHDRTKTEQQINDDNQSNLDNYNALIQLLPDGATLPPPPTPATYIPYATHVFTAVSVPEPSTFAIFALALVGLASRRFKK